MSAQEDYHFMLNGLDTFDWQAASGGVRLWEGKGGGGAAYVRPQKCHMGQLNKVRQVMVYSEYVKEDRSTVL